MMPLDPQSELEGIQKRIAFLSIADTPGMILVGLAIYGKFGGNAEDLHPILANSDVTTGMMVVGGVIVGWCLLEVLKLVRRRSEIERQLGGK